MSKTRLSQICRACLESSEKLYPLMGTVINVDVTIAAMISYCTSKEFILHRDLPDGVCVPCFKTIRIAYNFLRQFKESEEKLLMELACKRDMEYIDECGKIRPIGAESEINEDKSDIVESLNRCDDISNKNEIRYDLEIIHNYAERHDSNDVVDMPFEEGNLESFNLQTINSLNESETEEYPGALVEYVDDPNKIDEPEGSPETLENTSFEVVKNYLIWDGSASQSVSTETKPEIVQKDDDRRLSCEYACPICDLTFQRLQKFSDHIVSHDIDMIICNKCPGLVELNIFQYIQHYKEVHRYQCNICNRSLTSSYGYRYHMKQHENIRQYVCPAKNCKKSFFLLHLLKKHMRTHSTTIKYICNLCGAKFKTYDTYRYHQKTHGGKRNHLCTECGKAFFQAVHLRDHMFRHTGYKHFTCDMCGTSFTTNSQLKKHLNYCLKFKEKYT